MRKNFLFAFLLIMGVDLYAQSDISKAAIQNDRLFGNYQRFTITSLKARRNDGKFEKALTQNDVIGNDFTNMQRIFGINRNRDGSFTPTNYKPVDGFKRTFCGPMHAYYYSNGVYDHDQCIELELDKNNPLIKGNEWQYEKYRHQKFIQSFPPGSVPTVVVNHNWFFQPWNIIEGEINIAKSEADFGFSDLHTNVCIYGPWVFELYDPSEGHINAHKNNNEIHPMEQFWYKDKPIREGNTSYRLNFFVDASNRFEDKIEYFDIPYSQQPYFKPWSQAPMNGKFYLAFEVNRKRKESQTYWTESIVNTRVKPELEDGRNHFLVFGLDTLVRIFESTPEVCNISFENVGCKPLKGNRCDSSVIQGFIVISTRIIAQEGNPPPPPARLVNYGDFRLRVEKETNSSYKQSLQLTVEKIERLQLNSFRHYNPVNNTVITDAANSFNEEQVYISLHGVGQPKTMLIPIIKKGEIKIIEGLQSTRRGNLNDEYRFEIFCQNGPGGPELGKLVINGTMPVSSRTKKQTILLYPVAENFTPDMQNGDQENANRSLRVSLFAITYKIKVLPEKLDSTKTH